MTGRIVQALRRLLPLVVGGIAAMAASEQTVYLGTGGGGARGIYRATFAEGEASGVALAAEAHGASWLVHHAGLLVAVGAPDAERAREGAVTTWRIRDDGDLEPLDTASSGGRGPCHCSVVGDGRFVAVANYGGGTVALLPLAADGTLGEPRIVEHRGDGPHPKRQRGPHPHSATPAPDGAFVLACDLGTDRIEVYRLADGALVHHGGADAEPGGGPRHLAFTRDGRRALVNLELTGRVSLFDWDAAAGALAHRQTLSTLPDGFAGGNTTSQVRVSDDGRFAYVGNRGHDSIAVFAVNDEGLAPLARVAVGRHPRHFELSPDGRWLLVANRDDDDLGIYRVGDDGVPVDTGRRVAVPRATCVRFLD